GSQHRRGPGPRTRHSRVSGTCADRGGPPGAAALRTWSEPVLALSRRVQRVAGEGRRARTPSSKNLADRGHEPLRLAHPAGRNVSADLGSLVVVFRLLRDGAHQECSKIGEPRGHLLEADGVGEAAGGVRMSWGSSTGGAGGRRR